MITSDDIIKAYKGNSWNAAEKLLEKIRLHNGQREKDLDLIAMVLDKIWNIGYDAGTIQRNSNKG